MNSFDISSSSTFITCEKRMLFQSSSASSSRRMAIIAPLSAPTELPATAS